jgi:hypothetical protein
MKKKKEAWSFRSSGSLIGSQLASSAVEGGRAGWPEYEGAPL